MDSSAFDVLVVPILWGTVASIGAGAILLFVLRTVEAVLKQRFSIPESLQPTTRSGNSPLPWGYRRAARRSAIRAHG
jgi:hypothetical protein